MVPLRYLQQKTIHRGQTKKGYGRQQRYNRGGKRHTAKYIAVLCVLAGGATLIVLAMLNYSLLWMPANELFGRDWSWYVSWIIPGVIMSVILVLSICQPSAADEASRTNYMEAMKALITAAGLTVGFVAANLKPSGLPQSWIDAIRASIISLVVCVVLRGYHFVRDQHSLRLFAIKEDNCELGVAVVLRASGSIFCRRVLLPWLHQSDSNFRYASTVTGQGFGKMERPRSESEGGVEPSNVSRPFVSKPCQFFANRAKLICDRLVVFETQQPISRIFWEWSLILKLSPSSLICAIIDALNFVL